MPTTPPNGAATAPSSSSKTDRYLRYALIAVCFMLIGATKHAFDEVKWFNAQSAIREQSLKQTHAKQNVFRITTDRGGGTGYLIKDPRFGIVILTNKHICDMDPADEIFVLDQDDAVYYSKIRRKARLTDLCLIETPQELLTKYEGLSLAPDGTKLEYAETLYVYGHPGLRKLTGSSGPFVNESWVPRFSDDHIEAPTLRIGRSDIVIYPGSSGSPVLNKDGQVVGTVFGYEGQNHIALFVPLREMIEFLSGGM